jgi:hypothetical protein
MVKTNISCSRLNIPALFVSWLRALVDPTSRFMLCLKLFQYHICIPTGAKRFRRFCLCSGAAENIKKLEKYMSNGLLAAILVPLSILVWEDT